VSRRRFESAAATAAASLGPTRTKALATLLAQGRSSAYILGRLQTPAALEAVSALLASLTEDDVPSAEAAAYLRGYAAAWTRRREETEVRAVWTGPSTPGTPSRATAQVLTEVVGAAKQRFVAVTYSARAVADDRLLFLTSANLTAAGAERNIEAADPGHPSSRPGTYGPVSRIGAGQ
jgi:hypothetical protein